MSIRLRAWRRWLMATVCPLDHYYPGEVTDAIVFTPPEDGVRLTRVVPLPLF